MILIFINCNHGKSCVIMKVDLGFIVQQKKKQFKTRVQKSCPISDQNSLMHSSQVTHQAGAYPALCRMKRLRVFLLPPGWDASPSQGYPPALSPLVPIYTPG